MMAIIDNREKQRAYRALEYYKESGLNPVITTMKYGDFGFSDNNIGVIFEYKQVDDFISSMEDKRVFNQALNQSNHFEYHFVIIVGSEKEWDKAISDHGYHSGHYISQNQINGTIASLVNFTSVLQAKTEETAFDLMERIASKCTNDKPIIHRYPKSRGNPAFRLLVNNVSNIGEKTAQNIVDTLKISSIENVFNLTIEELCKVSGIGEKTAINILSQLKDEYM